MLIAKIATKNAKRNKMKIKSKKQSEKIQNEIETVTKKVGLIRFTFQFKTYAKQKKSILR